MQGRYADEVRQVALVPGHCRVAPLLLISTGITASKFKVYSTVLHCSYISYILKCEQHRKCTCNVGHSVAQLVEALRYKPDGRGFDSGLYHWNFSLKIFPAAQCPWGRLNLLQQWVPGIFPGGKGGPVHGADNISPSCVFRYGSLNILEL
jgi:hypothetical protein